MTIEEARSFIEFNIGEGIYDPEQFEGMSVNQLINFAEREDARAVAHYEAMAEEEEPMSYIGECHGRPMYE